MSNVPVSSEASNSSSMERRERERLRLHLPVHVQPVLPDHGQNAEVATTVDFNRNGLCFSSVLSHYSPGIVLFVTVPYASSTQNQRRLGEVVRVDTLSNGACAVAVRFVC